MFKQQAPQNFDFAKYTFTDFSQSFQNELIDFLNKGYRFLGYTSLELDSLDKDILNIKEIYQSPSCFKLLLDGDKIIATCAVKIYTEKNEAELKRVFVDENYQGQKLGKNLSLWAFQYAKDEGCNLMHIWSGTLCTKAHLLYQNLGAQNMQQERLIGGQDECKEFYFRKELN